MNKNFKELFQRYIDNLYSKKDLESVFEQIKNPENDEDIDKLTEQLWINLGDDTIANYEKIACEREARKLLARSKKTNRFGTFKRLVYYGLSAAALTLLVIKGVAFYESRLEEHVPMIAVTTDFGEQKTIVLPDNTELSINSCTTVKYPKEFVGNRRCVELIGEGCFKVTRNPQKPFVVKMNDMSITVLGTVFNVKSHTDDQTDLVEVKEGKVQVDMPEAMMRISAGEHDTINKALGSYSKEKDSIQKFAIWRTGGVRFNSTPIQDVAKELERIYHCEIVFMGNKPYEDLITGIHERATLKDILNSIEYATGIRYTCEGNVVTLRND